MIQEDNLDEEIELIKDPEIIEKLSQKIFSVLQTKDETNIISEFYNKEYKDVDLTLCINNSHNDNTILTTLVNYNLTRAANNFITTIRSFKKPSDEFLSYINKKNSKGYNALLYSAFRGNLEIFNKLMENGADISITNSSGLNVLHLAAQGNYPNIIIFAIEKYKFDINSKDVKGNSALHWAVYSNSKETVDYLIYYNIDINLKDNDGDTALQIAMRKGNHFLVKRIRDDFSGLLNGNELEDDKNKTNENSDALNQSDIFSLKYLMNKLMGENSKNSQSSRFLIIISVLEGINQIIILFGYCNYFMSMVFFILFSMLLFFYFATSKSDPGHILNECINSLTLLAQQGEDMKSICPWCINYIEKTTHHCFLCKKCIRYQQFHDIFVNNCIGKYNFSLYISFLYFLGINSCFKFIISFWALFWLKGSYLKRVVWLIIPQILAVCVCIAFCYLKLRQNMAKINDNNLVLFEEKHNEENEAESRIDTKKNLNHLSSF